MSLLTKRTIAQTWLKYLKLFGFIVIVSCGLSIISWLWFGRKINFGTTLEFDFFTTLSGWFSIIGIGMALYQIAELKVRREIVEDATNSEKITNFKRESLIKCDRVKTELQQLRKRILGDVFSTSIISGYIEELSTLRDILEVISVESKNLTSPPFQECDNCLTSLSELIIDLFKVIEENSSVPLKKQILVEKIRIINVGLLACENKLK